MVNCAALPPSLIETELFGHERGAFTDAREARAGLVETADRGTLFLDEIAELDQAGQAKLLTIFEHGWIRRVRGARRIEVDVRIICATNRNLDEFTRAGAFRADLYYRCCGFPIRLAPLRQEPSRIPGIVDRLLRLIGCRMEATDGPRVKGVDPQALAVLTAHPWPGNTRQLHHALLRAVLTCKGELLGPADLPTDILGKSATASKLDSPGDPGLGRVAQRYQPPANPAEECWNIVAVLHENRGHRKRAARDLGMSRQVLWERIRYYRIEESEWAS